MIRHVARGAFALVIATTVLYSDSLGQPGGTVRVYYRDSKTGADRSAEGNELKATPAGYQIISAGKVVATVSPADIVRVDPGEMPGVDRKDTLAQITLERDKKWEQARVNYVDINKKARVNKATPKVLQTLEFKIAYTSGKVADETADDAWEAKAKAAQTLLNDYLISYETGWEIWPAASMRGRLLVELGNPGEAASMWAKVAKNESVPADLQRDAALEEIDCLVRAKQFPEARDRIAKFPKTDAVGGVKERLAIYDAAIKVADSPPPAAGTPVAPWVKPIQDLVDTAKDPESRAVGFNMIGEVCMMADRPRDAMWSYLWVEVVYNADRDEVAKAMLRLAKSYEMQQDEERAKAYKDKLRRYRENL